MSPLAHTSRKGVREGYIQSVIEPPLAGVQFPNTVRTTIDSVRSTEHRRERGIFDRAQDVASRFSRSSRHTSTGHSNHSQLGSVHNRDFEMGSGLRGVSGITVSYDVWRTVEETIVE